MVEILNQQQQDFMVMKAIEIEDWTETRRHWWIGLTDLGMNNKRWFWTRSLKIVDFTAWSTINPGKNDNVKGAMMNFALGYEWYAEYFHYPWNPVCQFNEIETNF